MGERSAIADRLAALREALGEAALASGRDPSAVRLIAVSKKVGAESVAEAVVAGQREFGENYVSDGIAKIRALGLSGAASKPGAGLVWHMIGKLQSNKAARAARAFDLLHGLESLSAAKAISRAMSEDCRAARVLLQIKLGGGAQRAGIEPQGARAFLEQAAELPGLSFEGVMGVAPLGGDPKRHFARLREIAEALRALALPNAPMGEISAGMSGDYLDAVAEGATMVRIGTAVFGPRQ